MSRSIIPRRGAAVPTLPNPRAPAPRNASLARRFGPSPPHHDPAPQHFAALRSAAQTHWPRRPLLHDRHVAGPQLSEDGDERVRSPQGGRTRKFVVECKLRRGGLERTITEGVTQTRGYMDRCGAEAGHLIVFDRAPERTWAEKVFRRDPAGGTPVTVWGM